MNYTNSLSHNSNDNSSSGNCDSLEICLIIDEELGQSIEIEARKELKELILKSTNSLDVKLHELDHRSLDFTKTEILDTFHNSDIVIADLSHSEVRKQLIFHISTRTKENNKTKLSDIIFINSLCFISPKVSATSICSKATIDSLKDSFKELPIQLIEYAYYTPVALSPLTGRKKSANSKKIKSKIRFCSVYPETSLFNRLTSNKDNHVTVVRCLTEYLRNVRFDIKSHHVSRILAQLRRIREKHKNDSRRLLKELNLIKNRLTCADRMEIDVIFNIILIYDVMNDHDSIVKLVREFRSVRNGTRLIKAERIQAIYAKALIRRKKHSEDREEALDVCLELTRTCAHNMVCPIVFTLLGCIYKEKFLDSKMTDELSLKESLKWYRTGYQAKSTEYVGLNYAILLVAGKEAKITDEIIVQIVGGIEMLVGKQGKFEEMKSFEHLAILFEINLLLKNYESALPPLQRLFHINCPIYFLHYVMSNIILIKYAWSHDDNLTTDDSQMINQLNFWIQVFEDAISDDQNEIYKKIFVTHIRIPAFYVSNYDESLAWHQKLKPITISVNEELVNEKTQLLFDIQPEFPIVNNIESTSLIVQFKLDDIRRSFLYDRDDRGLFFFIGINSDEHLIIFPSSIIRNIMHSEIQSRLKQRIQKTCASDYESIISYDRQPEIQFDYAYDDENKHRMILGRGAFGTVFLGIDKSNGKQIAVKEIPCHLIAGNGPQPIQEEIRLHSKLKHKNIVKYLGSQIVETKSSEILQVFIEYISGGTLSELVRVDGLFGPIKCCTINAVYIKQMLEGLSYLHNEKIIHRDLKGSNILINSFAKSDDVIKITDFGTSKRLAGINMANTCKGTVGYMAPEVIDVKKGGYSLSADIWSLGCTIIEMLIGHFPFPEISEYQIMVKVASNELHPEYPNDIDPLLADFIDKCIVFEANKRSTAEQLLQHSFITKFAILRNLNYNKYNSHFSHYSRKGINDFEDSDHESVCSSTSIPAASEDLNKPFRSSSTNIDLRDRGQSTFNRNIDHQSIKDKSMIFTKSPNLGMTKNTFNSYISNDKNGRTIETMKTNLLFPPEMRFQQHQQEMLHNVLNRYKDDIINQWSQTMKTSPLNKPNSSLKKTLEELFDCVVIAIHLPNNEPQFKQKLRKILNEEDLVKEVLLKLPVAVQKFWNIWDVKPHRVFALNNFLSKAISKCLKNLKSLRMLDDANKKIEPPSVLQIVSTSTTGTTNVSDENEENVSDLIFGLNHHPNVREKKEIGRFSVVHVNTPLANNDQVNSTLTQNDNRLTKGIDQLKSTFNDNLLKQEQQHQLMHFPLTINSDTNDSGIRTLSRFDSSNPTEFSPIQKEFISLLLKLQCSESSIHYLLNEGFSMNDLNEKISLEQLVQMANVDKERRLKQSDVCRLWHHILEMRSNKFNAITIPLESLQNGIQKERDIQSYIQSTFPQNNSKSDKNNNQKDSFCNTF
ncbi:hypothetical protein SNEBB_005178 [Seison nebaliae]|nr:hypothetical protein SNEBB_005178 [Seison nebaliae]